MKPTIENTKLIALFMEALTIDMNGNIKEDLNSFKYNSSWNDLMPVVEKIESLGYYFNVTGTYCSIGNIDSKEGSLFIETDSKTKIEAIYKAIIEFINWYNQNK